MAPGSMAGVSGVLNCSVSHASNPTCFTCARSAGVPPNAACSRKRPALRFGVPRPVPGFVEATMLAVAVAVEEELAALVAWMFTLAGLGSAAGAVYRPAAEIVPTLAL